MCLDSKSRIAPPKTGWFYKAVYVSNKGTIESGCQGTHFRRGEWMNASKNPILMDSTGWVENVGYFLQEYPAGFHGYATLKEALLQEKYFMKAIIKVRYIGGHTQGKQNRRNVIVASKIYVPKNPKNLRHDGKQIPRI